MIAVVAMPTTRRVASIGYFGYTSFLNFRRNSGGRTKLRQDTQKHPTKEMTCTKPGTNAARNIHTAHRTILVIRLYAVAAILSFPSIIFPHCEISMTVCDNKKIGSEK